MVELDLLQVVRTVAAPNSAEMKGRMAGVARALIIRDVNKQLDQDKVVWDRMRFEPNPIICDAGDGPIPQFRKFYSRFYAGGDGPRRGTPSRIDRGRAGSDQAQPLPGARRRDQQMADDPVHTALVDTAAGA